VPASEFTDAIGRPERDRGSDRSELNVKEAHPVDPSRLTGEIDRDRRRFLGGAALVIGAAGAGQLGMSSPARAQTRGAGVEARTPAKPGTTWSFGPVRQLKAGVLDVGYVEAGPAGGRPVILLHGFPYDIHSFVEVAPLRRCGRTAARPWYR
jgi:hypothetical protein